MYPSKGGQAVRVMIAGERETIWAPTKRDLTDKVKKAINDSVDRSRGLDPDDQPPRTYGELCERRLEVYRRRESSKATFEANLNASIKEFGDLRLDQIKRHRIEKWAIELERRELAPVTVSNYLDDMQRTIEYARDSGWLLGPNPVKTVDRPLVEFEPDPFESWHEIFEIAGAFQAIGFPVGSEITRFGTGLGLRMQELLCGRECDVDRVAKTFHVQRTWDDKLRKEVELTKTSASRANLNLTAVAAEVIDEIPPALHRDPKQWERSPLLFTRADGCRITPDYFRDRWEEALATLPHIRYRPPKSMRSTFATLTLLELGLDHMNTVATLMRHTFDRTTRQHYTKIVQQLRLRAASEASRGMPSFAAHPRTHTG